MIQTVNLIFRKVIVKLCRVLNYSFIKNFKINKKQYFRFHIHKKDCLSLRIYEKGLCDFEPKPIRYLLKKICGQSGTFLDIGAFSGIYSILACRSNPAIRAIAIEPNQHILSLLMNNLKINGIQADVLPFYFSNKRKIKKLYIPENDPSCASLDACQAELWRGGGAVNSIQVRGSGTSFLRGKKILGVKIDVEGAELEALSILKNIMIQTKPFVIVESANQRNKNKIIKFFKELSYRKVEIPRSKAAPPHETMIFEKQIVVNQVPSAKAQKIPI